MQPPEERDAPEYLLEHLRAALAGDERVNALDLEVRFQGDEVLLMGCVQSHDRREAIETVARQVLPHHPILNEVQVIHLDGTPETISAPSAVRIAAVGDIHFGTDSHAMLRPHLSSIDRDADMLLLAGDLTRHGTEAEAAVLAGDLEGLPVPVIAVLGNHDHQSDHEDVVAQVLIDAGVIVLEKSSCVLEVGNVTVGIAGTKGFGGGFAGACGSEFGERIMKAFIAETRSSATALQEHLSALDTDVRIALMHYSPVEDTLRGEKPEIYGWLGSYLLAEAVDHAGCDYVFHGHAHAGAPNGLTPGGIPVRNVAQPVIGQAYKVYCVEPNTVVAGVTAIGSYAG